MNHTQNESTIHSRYENLSRKCSSAKKKINGLKKLKDEISEETYKTLYSENKAIMDDIEPQLDSLKKEIYTIINNMTKEIKIIEDEINEKKTKIQEFEKLLNAKIIDEEKYHKDVAPLKEKRNNLQNSLVKKNKEILNLKKAIGSSLGIPSKPKNQSYIKRFFTYLALSQLLGFIFSVVINVLSKGKCSTILLIATCVAFTIAGFFLIFKYLFKYVKSHASYLVFSGIGYTILSVIILVQLFDHSMYVFYFFNLFLIWNLIFSVIILIFGLLNIPLHNYRNSGRSMA